MISEDTALWFNLEALGSLPTPPEKFKDLDGREDKDLWLSACVTEYLAKKRNGTWVLVDRPPNKHVVKTRLRFTYKYDPTTGALPDAGGHRVRWVGCGYSGLP